MKGMKSEGEEEVILSSVEPWVSVAGSNYAWGLETAWSAEDWYHQNGIRLPFLA